MRCRSVWIPAVLALAAAAAGCRHQDQYVPRSRTPGVDGEPADRVRGSEQVRAWTFFPAAGGIAGTAAGDLADFCATVAASPRAGSVGCLPLVMYDSDHSGPWVPELGTSLADAVSDGLRDGGFKGAVLSPVDMGIRLSQVNLEKVALTSAEAIAASGDRLGVDVVVFGTMKRVKDPGTAFLQRIQVDLSAYGFLSGSVVARKRFELRSDSKDNAAAWAAAGNESLWMPGTEWNVPAPEKGFDEELRVVAGLLAKRALQGVDLAALKGAVYIPPAETGRFVRSVAKLRAAQSSFAQEYERRAKEAMKGQSPLDIEMPVTLNGVEFRTLQAADAYLATLREQLMASETALFSGTVASMIAEAMRTQVSPVLLDVGFTKGSDLNLMEGELATGGLARSLHAREALRDQKIDLVVAPKIEKVGANFALRVEVYDLRTPNVMSSSSMRIEPRYAGELARQLAVDDLAAIDDLPAVERTTWEKVNETVGSGVVLLTGRTGDAVVQGTGFVVSASGLVMTNSHVARALGAGGTATFAGGRTSDFDVVKDDPSWDLALLRLRSMPENVHVFTFADPARAKVGVEVAVLGNPKGTEGWVLAPGYVSSIRERIVAPDGTVRPSFMYTCPTRGGNSGSPVFLPDGTVIAVHSAGKIGDVKDRSGYEIMTEKGKVFSELTGFALGAPAAEARKLVEAAGGAR